MRRGDEVKRVFLAFGLAAVTLSACAVAGVNLPLVAVDQVTGERYIGNAVSRGVGASSFQVTSETGILCSGTYVARTTSTGSGTCSNGETLSWTVTGDLSGGQGFGQLGARRALVYYGDFATQQQFR